MHLSKIALFAGVSLLALGLGTAQAASYGVTVSTGLTNGGFATLPGASPFTGTPAQASFTYTGDINFVNNAAQNSPSVPAGDQNGAFGFSTTNVSGYTAINSGPITFNGAQVANFSSLANFLASSGSVAGYGYGSLFAFNLGSIAAGTNLVITHDDGISLFRGATQVSGGVVGPTGQVTDTFTNLDAGAYTLYYSRQNGTPSILTVAVPEPASMALFGAGLMGLAMVRRRRAAPKA